MQLERISSKSNPTVLWAASLHEKKYRDRSSSFLVEGKKLVEECLSLGLPVTHLFIAENKWEDFSPIVARYCEETKETAVRVFLLADPCFQKISTEQAPQGIIAALKHLDFFKSCIKINIGEISPEERAVFLYSVRDPGNLGAILRSAAAFGINTVLLSADCADIYNPKTLRAAMGGVFRLRILSVADAEGSISTLREAGRRVWAAELRSGALSLRETNVKGSDVFVIGNEGHGIAPSVSEACDGSVYIPIAGVESLNASVAASVLLWEQSKFDLF
ncbi:MAG: RNA methyltransferase [Clostridia bacterium]|nr:RNA methyltransferase [Clostridia bacterium]